MSVDFIHNAELSCKCYSFEILKQRGIINLKYSAFDSDGVPVQYVGSVEVNLSDYADDPRFADAQAFLQEIADSNNPKNN